MLSGCGWGCIPVGHRYVDFTDNGTAVQINIDDVAMPDELAERGRGPALAKSALGLLSYHRDKSGNHWRLISQAFGIHGGQAIAVAASPKPGYRIHGRAIRDFDIRAVSRSSAGPGSSRRRSCRWRWPSTLWSTSSSVQSGDPPRRVHMSRKSPLTIARRRRVVVRIPRRCRAASDYRGEAARWRWRRTCRRMCQRGTIGWTAH